MIIGNTRKAKPAQIRRERVGGMAVEKVSPVEFRGNAAPFQEGNRRVASIIALASAPPCNILNLQAISKNTRTRPMMTI